MDRLPTDCPRWMLLPWSDSPPPLPSSHRTLISGAIPDHAGRTARLPSAPGDRAHEKGGKAGIDLHPAGELDLDAGVRIPGPRPNLLQPAAAWNR